MKSFHGSTCERKCDFKTRFHLHILEGKHGWYDCKNNGRIFLLWLDIVSYITAMWKESLGQSWFEVRRNWLYIGVRMYTCYNPRWQNMYLCERSNIWHGVLAPFSDKNNLYYCNSDCRHYSDSFSGSGGSSSVTGTGCRPTICPEYGSRAKIQKYCYGVWNRYYYKVGFVRR